MTIFHEHELLAILRDDCPYSDITTEGLGIGDVLATLRMTARQDMILCVVEEAARMFVLGGASVTAARRIRSLLCIRCPRRFLCASGCNQCCSEDVSNETGVS